MGERQNSRTKMSYGKTYRVFPTSPYSRSAIVVSSFGKHKIFLFFSQILEYIYFSTKVFPRRYYFSVPHTFSYEIYTPPPRFFINIENEMFKGKNSKYVYFL